MLEELRKNAYKILNSGEWLSTVQEGDREVRVSYGSFYCYSRNNFDPELRTNDIEEAINYLYPEF